MKPFLASLRRMHDHWSRRHPDNRVFETLGHLDTHTLRDIGLTRGECLAVPAAATGDAAQSRIRSAS